MAKKSKKRLDEKEIGSLVDRKLQDAVGWNASNLSRERERVMKYYNGELPRRQSEGNSSYISTDVYDAVEGMKAQLLETFGGSYEICAFDPQGPEDVEQCRIGTEYTNYVIFRQNKGYDVFDQVIADGLMHRVGVVKVYWEAKKDFEDYEIQDANEEEVNALAMQEDVEEMEAEMSPNGLYSGKMTRAIDRGKVTIENIAPEEFVIEGEAKALSSEYFCAHRTIKTIAELVNLGYDQKKLQSYNMEDDSILQNSPELLARFNRINDGQQRDYVQDELRLVMITESYIRLVLENDGIDRLYKVVRCGKVTLDMQEIDRLPFMAFVPLTVPHSFWGNSFAAQVIQTQNAKTVLIRSILDHSSVTNNPRYQVVKGGLVNPRELLDNRLGGLVNVTRPDAVVPLPQASLNPFVYQTIQMLNDSSEKNTGLSSLSQGLNKDAISKQNSEGMIENLVSLSQTRQKVVARAFAFQFLIPLFIEVYRLVLENETKENVIELAGNWVPVNPKTWIERKDATVTLKVGYGEQERQAEKLIGVMATLQQDPDLASMVLPQNKYNAAVSVLKASGFKNFNDFITPPQKVPPKEPDPMLMKQMELEDRTVAVQELKAATDKAANDHKAQMDELKAQMDELKTALDQQIKLRDAERKDADIANKIDIAQREMALAENVTADAEGSGESKSTAIVSPNS